MLPEIVTYDAVNTQIIPSSYFYCPYGFLTLVIMIFMLIGFITGYGAGKGWKHMLWLIMMRE